MPEWFIMVMLASKLVLVGPFTERECQSTKQLLFSNTGAVCIEREMVDGKRST